MKQPTAAQTVDALGKVRARIAELEKEDKALCELLKATGKDRIAGRLYEATMVKSTKRTLDIEVIKATLNPQFIADHTKATPYVAVRITERKP